MPHLIFWIQQRDWSRAIVHCQKYPEQAKVGKNGMTPLLVACHRPDSGHPDYEPFLRALLAANPDALLSHNIYGDLPLHKICRNMDKHPISLELLREFVIRQPTTACQPIRVPGSPPIAETPLFLLCRNAPFHGETLPPSHWSSAAHQRAAIFWDKFELLVDAVLNSQKQPSTDHHNNISPDRYAQGGQSGLYKIHACILVQSIMGCYSNQMLEYVCYKYPRQVHTRDERGRLPLHVLLTTPAPRLRNPQGQWVIVDVRMLQLLLAKYPHAARARLFSKWDHCDKQTGKHTSSGNVYGRYPLHIALAHGYGWREGVEDLFQAAPDIVTVRDPETQLYPFQLAAVPYQKDNSVVKTETIFQLLRHHPELVMDTLC